MKITSIFFIFAIIVGTVVASSTKTEEFEKWLKDHGVTYSDVEIQYSDAPVDRNNRSTMGANAGYSLVAKSKIKKGHTFVHVPRSVLLTDRDVFSSPVMEFARHGITDQVGTFGAFVSFARDQIASVDESELDPVVKKYAPYINILPHGDKLPLSWATRKLRKIEAFLPFPGVTRDVYQASIRARIDPRFMASKSDRKLYGSLAKMTTVSKANGNPASDPKEIIDAPEKFKLTENFAEDGFMSAQAVVWARALENVPYKGISRGEMGAAMIPLIDMMGFEEPSESHHMLRGDADAVWLVAGRDIEKGENIKVPYATRGLLKTFARYGFVPEHGPADASIVFHSSPHIPFNPTFATNYTMEEYSVPSEDNWGESMYAIAVMQHDVENFMPFMRLLAYLKSRGRPVDVGKSDAAKAIAVKAFCRGPLDFSECGISMSNEVKAVSMAVDTLEAVDYPHQAMLERIHEGKNPLSLDDKREEWLDADTEESVIALRTALDKVITNIIKTLHYITDNKSFDKKRRYLLTKKEYYKLHGSKAKDDSEEKEDL